MHLIEDIAGHPSGTGRAQPIRTCVGCRTRAAQVDLLRLVAVDGRLELDLERRRSGRGAYLHRDKACLGQAIKRGLFSRALRTRLDPVSSAELRERVVSILESPMHLPTQQSVLDRATPPSSMSESLKLGHGSKSPGRMTSGHATTQQPLRQETRLASSPLRPQGSTSPEQERGE